jgi:1-acyl-sn-glycerol-3-phosphate acyltransferase
MSSELMSMPMSSPTLIRPSPSVRVYDPTRDSGGKNSDKSDWLGQWLGYIWYEVARWLLTGIFSFAYSLRFRGRQNIPKDGPILFIANHQSFLDPAAIGLSCPRHLSYLARKTLFKNPIFGKLLRSLNSVPVDQQGVAKEGMKNILEALKNGRAVLVFPEGERTWKGNIQALKPGIQLLIKRTKATIIPVGIAGFFDALPRIRAWPQFSPIFWPATNAALGIVIGKPLDASQFADLPREEMLVKLQEELEKVHTQAEKLRRKP